MFILQAIFSVIINFASLWTTLLTTSNELRWTDYLGIAVWLVGFTIEVVGDWQLRRHIADKTEGKKKFIAWGLWRYTRHPNYFGEAVLWWGVWLLACSTHLGYLTVFAPIVITLLVRFVSGVPMLEKKY